MKISKKAIASFVATAAFALVAAFVIPTGTTFAADSVTTIQNGINAAGGSTGADATTLTGVFKIIVNVMLFIIGALSVIMLIYGGIRYTLSGGDSGSVTSAKNTIMYAIIGLIVAFLAFAIVNWVLGALQGNASNS